MVQKQKGGTYLRAHDSARLLVDFKYHWSKYHCVYAADPVFKYLTKCFTCVGDELCK